MTVGDIASLIYISRQVNVARLQAKGQFLLALDAQFEKYNEISIKSFYMRVQQLTKTTRSRDPFGFGQSTPSSYSWPDATCLRTYQPVR